MIDHRYAFPAWRRLLVVGVGALALSGCGYVFDSEALPPPSVPTTVPTTVPPTTTTTTTTVPPTTTTRPTTTTTTVRPTTTTIAPSTTEAAPESTLVSEAAPVDPPIDSYASEPVIPRGNLSIPRIGVSMTMYEGIREPTLNRGPGYWPGSALPGQPGNLVVAGHRTSHHAVFRNIDQLEPGDEIVFDDDNGRHVYRVNRTEIVSPDAVWIINPTETPTATLFACHPPGSVRQRIVVFADLVTG